MEKYCYENGKLLYIEMPIFSEQANEDGGYDIVGYRREYV